MEYNKILVEIHHGLGDVVQMIPLLSNLRENFREAKIYVIVASDVHAEILKCTRLVDNYFYLNMSKMTYWQILNFIQDLRNEKFDIGFLSSISNKMLGAILLYILGCKWRVGEKSKRSKLLINNNITVEEDTSLHRVERNLNLLRAAGIKVYNTRPIMKIDEGIIKKAKTKLSQFSGNGKTIGICIGTNPVEARSGFKKMEADVKKWDIKNYIALIKKLTRECNVILLGGKREEEDIKEFSGALKNNKRVMNLINQTTILESAALANECDLVIGGDTGMMHIADALGKTTLTIFGPTDPNLVGPMSEKSNNVTLNISCQYCYGTDKLFKCKDRKCLNNITVDYIYNKVIDILK